MNPLETEAKLALDQELAALAAQRSDLRDLQSRAKDLIGLLTLAGTFWGAFGKDATGGILQELQQRSDLQVALFVFFPAVTFLCGLYVMVPRRYWAFNLDGTSMKAAIEARPAGVAFPSNARLYLRYAERVNELYKHNIDYLSWRGRALSVAIAALVLEVMYVVALVVY